MGQGADNFDDDEAFESFPDPEVARIVLELDRTITRRRRAGAISHSVEGRPVPVKPSHIELRVLTTLAQTYGPLLFGKEFEPVLEHIAKCGAVVLVQRAMWGDLPEDHGLAAPLLDARIPFEILCGTWPDVFMAQAHAELKGFRPRPPHPRMESDDGERDDG
ncbi:hypothetical protein QCE73_36545 [Caballeronia sp. LZ029]|uniref:hypothetical protein n=1 Tax=Caballeronia sp. LZ029 TaxID=3038564 RepID=UPI002861BAE0|nr:hypothetical protein [Caballeronia sp. LZ029]MDR5748698.1 hypothetical protein [Caballeronia sp. LZ029]